jgi:hypothetical protein
VPHPSPLVVQSASAPGTVVDALLVGKTTGDAVGPFLHRSVDIFEGLFEDSPIGHDGDPSDPPGRVDGTRVRSRDLPVAKERKP